MCTFDAYETDGAISVLPVISKASEKEITIFFWISPEELGSNSVHPNV